jgi:hypothetical protein
MFTTLLHATAGRRILRPRSTVGGKGGVGRHEGEQPPDLPSAARDLDSSVWREAAGGGGRPGSEEGHRYGGGIEEEAEQSRRGRRAPAPALPRTGGPRTIARRGQRGTAVCLAGARKDDTKGVFGRAPAPPNQLWSNNSTNLQLHRGAELSLWS